MILSLMAATSHDFWLRNLTPPVWKTLHMLVYVAYALLVAHVTLGLLQSETSPMLGVGTGFGLLTVITPVFATNDFNGSPAVLLLTGPNQKRLPREAFLDRVAQPTRIHGRVMQIGNRLLLETESSAIGSHRSCHPPEQGR
jgi:hypothetical protein